MSKSVSTLERLASFNKSLLIYQVIIEGKEGLTEIIKEYILDNSL